MTEFTKVDMDITRYKPKMKPVYVGSIADLRFIPFIAGKETVQVKADGEFNFIHVYKDGAYALNRFGRMTRDLPALKELHALFLKNAADMGEADLLAEMYAVDDNGKPLSLPNFIHYLKGGDPKLHNNIHLGIFQMITAVRNSAVIFPMLEKAFSGKLVHVLDYIIPWDFTDLEKYWQQKVVSEGYEGLVIRVDGDTYKAKPNCDVDAVIIGVNKNNKGYARGLAKSVKVALMPTENTFMELGDATIPSEAEACEVFALTRVKLNESANTAFVKPLMVVKIDYISLFPQTTNTVYKMLLGGMMEIGQMKGVRMKSPRVVGYRKDKHACTADVGLNQIGGE